MNCDHSHRERHPTTIWCPDCGAFRQRDHNALWGDWRTPRLLTPPATDTSAAMQRLSELPDMNLERSGDVYVLSWSQIGPGPTTARGSTLMGVLQDCMQKTAGITWGPRKVAEPVGSVASDTGIESALRDVREFHAACKIGERSPSDPAALTRGVTRYRLLREEYEEYVEASVERDVVEVADALADIIYIALGSALIFFGRDRFARVWKEVHRSNMAKCVDGSVVIRDDGKILKPDGWTSPDIAGALNTNTGETT